MKRLFPNKLPTHKQRGRTCRPRLEALEDRLAPASFGEFIDPNPNPGNQFGHSVVALSTGNVVITSPYDDFGGPDAGAVYLFNGATGALISTLRGSSLNDNIGSTGVTALSNGNYVVRSVNWDNAGTANVGAATWGDGDTGISGVVSIANSLVGSTAGDQVGSGGVTALSSGNYVVASPAWGNGGLANVGAATWGDGDAGVSGVVSAANSLVGSTAEDKVGAFFYTGPGVVPLTNGNYVVVSRFWDNGGLANVGAVTWGDGDTGISGVVSIANSLVGSTAEDMVGFGGVVPLTNGNYVVASQNWDNGGLANVGAVTWGDGDTGIIGVVSTANSLVGSTAEDKVGVFTTIRGVAPLSNGNYVVTSPDWDNGGLANVGAATWGDGDTGIIGVISEANSLVGSTADDQVGYCGVVPLTNGNYVVGSPDWHNSGIVQAGAATWGDGDTGIIGVVSTANSLVGSNTNEAVGSESLKSKVTALSNGNYVVLTPYWTGAQSSAGAATWGDGDTGISGVISEANSLVGSKYSDLFGSKVVVLSNGNYVVASPSWSNGGVSDVGAATWGDGDTGISGVISEANSLVGSTAGDGVGSGGVTVLSNGNYVVASPSWSNGGVSDVGAATWGDGDTGISGVISEANSLVGSTAGDGVGSGGVTALNNGNYVVTSPVWDNGGLVNAGAATWGDGTGVTGVITKSNSAIGLAANTDLRAVVADNVNGNFYAPFLTEGGGKVRVGSSTIGFADQISPTVLVTIAPLTLTNGRLSSTVTFEFSEPVVGFDRKDVAVMNGSLSNFTAVSDTLFTAVFTAKNRTVATGAVSVGPHYTDVFGNLGTEGSDTVVINSKTPTLLPNGRVGPDYGQTLPTRNGVGSPGFRFVSGKLPPGLVLSADGVLSGKPKQKGVYTFTVEARDTRTYELTILEKRRSSKD